MYGLKAIIGMTLLTLLFAACDPALNDEHIQGFVEPELTTGEIVVRLTTDQGARYVACTDFVKFYRLDDLDAAPIEGPLGHPLDGGDGYILDGEFVPPTAGMGCDIQSCEQIDGYERTYTLFDYEYVGDKTLTAQEKDEYLEYYLRTPMGENVPDTLPEYTSQPVTGTVTMEVTYWLTDGCTGTDETESEFFYTTEFVIE